MIDTKKLVWRRAPENVLAAVTRAIAPWEGTPYRVGQQAPGRQGGVDCVRFVCAVLDDVTGRQTPIRTLPQDVALHARVSAILAMKKIKQLYMPNEQVTDLTIEAGDLLVTALPNGGPSHVLIAGAKPWHLWESTENGVRRTGLGGIICTKATLHYIYRLGNKQDWK